METLHWTLGDRIAKARRTSGLTQAGLAMRLRVSRKTVTAWELDQHRPRRREVEDLAALCGVPLSWLTDEDDNDTTTDAPTGGYATGLRFARAA